MTQNPPFDDGQSVIPGVPHRWTALTIALTAIGFIVFWPLGLAMIAYVVWGEKLRSTASSTDGPFAKARKAAEDFGRTVRDEFRPRDGASGFGASGFGTASARRTGNAAFDAWRDGELRRMEEERRKLDATTSAFEAHLRAERGAFDEGRQREEFERFMSGRG